MPSRREFFEKSAACASAAAAGAVGFAASEQDAAMKPDDILDYGRSFIRGTADFNNVRFWIESRTILFDDDAGTHSEYYQCASCKSENTFAEKDLFHEENYDFLPILGDGRWLIFRRPASISPRYRQIQSVDEVWGEPELLLRAAPATVLDDWEAIRDATAAGRPLVTRTEIADEKTRLRAIIECPTKTMNISLDRKMYQVDTGPAAFPDLSQRFSPAIDCLQLAFVAFNAPHFADFILERPTPVTVDGEESRHQVYHYSAPFSLPAKNVVLALP